MGMLTPKLQYLARVLRHVIYNLKERVIMFCDWLTTLYVYELFLKLLGINFVMIRTAHKGHERKAAIARFNDPNEKLNALLIFREHQAAR